MSYSQDDARLELDSIVEQAVKQRDVETLFAVARRFKEAGDDEYAETLRGLAKRFEREDWAHDEANDNKL